MFAKTFGPRCILCLLPNWGCRKCYSCAVDGTFFDFWQAGDKLKGKANEAGRKAQNAVGDNAGLPSPQEVSHCRVYLLGFDSLLSNTHSPVLAHVC